MSFKILLFHVYLEVSSSSSIAMSPTQLCNTPIQAEDHSKKTTDMRRECEWQGFQSQAISDMQSSRIVAPVAK
jgi:hypothetical protein